MNPFLIAFLLVALVSVGLYFFVKLQPGTLARAIRAFTATFAALAGTGLLLAGRLGLAIITICAAIVALRALRSSNAGQFGWGGTGGSTASANGPSGKTSEIRTDTLSMTLDHRTGDLNGDILKGPYAGRTLSSLGLQELLRLLMDCQRDDPRSVPLLETYLDRYQADWRSHASGENEGHDDHDSRRAQANGNVMDRATACSILGIPSTATPKEIKEAHRRLMNKLHPDHGGSNYLAAQLNQAKDVLLGR